MRKITFLERNWTALSRMAEASAIAFAMAIPDLETPIVVMPRFVSEIARNVLEAYAGMQEADRLAEEFPWKEAYAVVPVADAHDYSKEAAKNAERIYYYLVPFSDPWGLPVFLLGPPKFNYLGLALQGETSTTFLWENENLEALAKKNHLPGNASAEDEILMVTTYATALLALTASCNNLRSSPVYTDGQERARQHECRRKGLPHLNYHSVQIKLARREREEGQPRRQTPANWEPLTPLHLRRGHVKSYENGAGLFGKLHGSWWWTPHLAGREENGTSLKEYEIVP